MKKENNVLHYEISIVPNEYGGYYARVPDFPTLFTGGQTAEEATANALAAIELMLDELRERGLPAPEPKSSYSGHFNIRVPKELHRELVKLAETEGVSLNSLVAYLLTKSFASGAVRKSPSARGRA